MSTAPTSPTSPVPPGVNPLLQQPPENIFRAVQPYNPRHDGEIALHLGDIITNTKDLGNGWTLGQNVSRDILGIFPSHSIQPLSVANTALQGLAHGSSTSVDHFHPGTTNNKQQQPGQGSNPNPSSVHTKDKVTDPGSEIKPATDRDHPRAVNYNPQLGTFCSPHKQQGSHQNGIPPAHNNNNTIISNSSRGGGGGGQQYVQVAQQNTGGRVTSSLLPTDRQQHTAPQTPDLPYEVLRSRPDLDSGHMTNRDIDFHFSKQKESPHLYKPPPGGRPQNYSRENSLSDADYPEGGSHSSNLIRDTTGDQLGARGVRESDYSSPVKSSHNKSPVKEEETSSSNIATSKGKSSRRASPKRVRVALDCEQTEEKAKLNQVDREGDKEEEGGYPPTQRLPHLISQAIEQGIGSQGDNQQTGAPVYTESQASVNSERSDSSSTPLPSPLKRGRFNQKPQLAVKPNHLCSEDSMEGETGRGGEHVTNRTNLKDSQTVGGFERVPQSPKVQSSPRVRVKASPRQQRRGGGGGVNTITGSRIHGPPTPPLQLHNATSDYHHPQQQPLSEMEAGSNVRRIPDYCEQQRQTGGNHTNPLKTPAAARVTPAPIQPHHHHYMEGSCTDCSHCNTQPRSTTSPGAMYASRDTLHSCGGGSIAPQCNSLLYDTDNYTNETLTRESSLPPSAAAPSSSSSSVLQDRESYGDYRMDKAVRFRTQQTNNGSGSTCRYKPILKHQRVGDSKSQPSPHHMYYQEDRSKDPAIRMVFSVLCGLVIGFIVFCWMFFCLYYPLIVALSVSVTMAILAILALALSRLVRCVTAIALPSTCTTRGRIACLVLVTGLLISGPVRNIYLNMHEVSRSMGCSAEQVLNQSMLLLEPFDSMMQQLESTVAQLEYAAWEVDRGLRPLDASLERVDQNIDKGKMFLTYTSQACTGMIENAFSQCMEGISAAQRKCLGVITDLGTVYIQAKNLLDKINPERWAPKQQHLFKRQILLGGTSATPIEREMTGDDKDICVALDMNQVCESLNQTELLCKPSMWAGDAIQEAINATQKAMGELRKQLQFNVKADPFSLARVNASKVVFHIRQAVTNQFESRTMYFHQVISIIVKILPVAVLLLLYVSYVHVKHYMSRDTYDNNYITKAFWALDQKRSEVAGDHLFPLKPFERRSLVDTTVSELSPPEEGLFRIGLCVFLLHLLLSIVCYLFDFILFWILSLIKYHGQIPQDVTGQASLENVLEGEGVIVELLDIFLVGFHRAHSYGFYKGSNQCLPDPHTPALAYIIAIAVLYVLLLLTILFKAYLIRLRNNITGFFYPERCKQRTVHLYNVMLNQRARLPNLLHARARTNHRERRQREEISFCHKMALRCAPCRVFLYRSSRCLVCGLAEDHTFRDCETDKCMGVYCALCYSDLGRVCPLCLQGTEYEGDGEEYEDMGDEVTGGQRSSQIYL